MDFDSNKPIFIQIADNISNRILAGELKPGSRIPSVREWGTTIGVNPNTVARSYDLLAQRGVIFNLRGKGFYVAGDAPDVIRRAERRIFIEEEFPAFRKRANLLGIDLKDLLMNP